MKLQWGNFVYIYILDIYLSFILFSLSSILVTIILHYFNVFLMTNIYVYK